MIVIIFLDGWLMAYGIGKVAIRSNWKVVGTAHNQGLFCVVLLIACSILNI